MIRLDQISKQHGRQILFVEAAAAVHRGEKVGLVGPNGAGKSTVFRLITGEEVPDDGQVSIDRGMTVGHFNQDVGEMCGRPVVAEVMDGVGPVSEVAAELAHLEQAMADPARADDMAELVERFGEVQARFEDLDGYGLEARAREVLAGLGFSQEMMDGDAGRLSGGWKMRAALARILLMRPSAMLLDEPSNHLDIESLIWLEHFLATYDGALLTQETFAGQISGGIARTYDANFRVTGLALNGANVTLGYDRDSLLTSVGAMTFTRNAANGFLSGTTLGSVTFFKLPKASYEYCVVWLPLTLSFSSPLAPKV